MPKAKIFITTLIAIISLSAIASASASAAGWMVNKAELTGSTALATTAKTVENIKLVFAGATVECSGENVEGTSPQIEAPNKGSTTSVRFSDCKATGKNCALASSMKEKVASLPVSVEDTLGAGKTIAGKFTPKIGTLFATIALEGVKCSFAEEVQPVKGTVKVEGPIGQEENTLQEAKADATEASGELKVGSTNASISGAVDLKPANSEPWSLL